MEYSITRLLVMKKSTEKELTRLLEHKPLHVSTTVKASVAHTEKEKIKSRQKAFLDTLMATLTKRDMIASAIAESNAATKVKVEGKEMTVTAAIDRKNNIDTEKAFCNLLVKASTANENTIERAERQIEEEASSRAQILAGRDKAVTKEALDIAKASVEELYKMEVVEPQDIYVLAITKRAEIDAFMEEIDVVLNESNATTKVTLNLTV
jgi:hypothetical protein